MVFCRFAACMASGAEAAGMLVSLAACRPVQLSLEQFETDVQPIVNEYLLGLIREVLIASDGSNLIPLI